MASIERPEPSDDDVNTAMLEAKILVDQAIPFDRGVDESDTTALRSTAFGILLSRRLRQLDGDAGLNGYRII